MKSILLTNFDDSLASLVDFLSQTEVIFICIVIILFYIWYRFLGLKEQIAQAKIDKEMEQTKLEEKRRLYEKEMAKQKTENPAVNGPQIIYVKESKDYSFALTCLAILLILSLVANFIQYQQLSEYNRMFGDLKDAMSIFQQLVR